jgi:ATP-dependent DNA helicase RecQ
MIQRWTLKVARFIDRGNSLPDRSKALEAALRFFGIRQFRDGQLEAVLAALRGESILVIRPTGGGKSLCFQLPALLHAENPTFVLSPLKALMEDQVKGLQELKLPATFINGDIGKEEKELRYELLESSGVSLFYATPERFNAKVVKPEEVKRLLKLRPGYLVVDEAHVVDKWGTDFRPDYGRIKEIRRKLGNPPVLAFTATAGADAQMRIKKSLGIEDAESLISGVDRPNISLARVPGQSNQAKANIVAELLHSRENGKVMIFVPTVNVGKEVKQLLLESGAEIPLYYSKLPKEEREEILGRFTGRLEPDLPAVICTSAFSMGLDIPDIRAVISWQHNACVEDYLQAFGRGGRDGKQAYSILFTGSDSGLLRWMIDKTLEKALSEKRINERQAKEIRKVKEEDLLSMERLAGNRDRCFREALNEALIGESSIEETALPERMVRWALAERDRVETAAYCCDVCNPELPEIIKTGQLRLGAEST